MPSLVQACLLFGLDDGVVNSLAHGLKVVLVPEQIRVATVRSLVVHHRAVGCRRGAGADDARPLADVVVALQHFEPKILPPLQ